MTDPAQIARRAEGRPVWRDAAGVPFLEADCTATAAPLRLAGTRRPRAHLTTAAQEKKDG